MRISIDISDELHNDLKVSMALKKQSIKDFVREAIETKLLQEKQDSMTSKRIEEFVKRRK